MSGALANWKEFHSENLVTVGTSDLFSFKKINNDERIVKSKVCMRSSKSEEKDLIYGYSLLQYENCLRFVTLSKNGALYRMKTKDDIFNNKYLLGDKNLGYLCVHCLCLKADNKRLDEHVSTQHLGPVKCKMCFVQKEDVFELKKHLKLCSYACGVEGCDVKHLRLVEAKSHMRKYLNSVKSS